MFGAVTDWVPNIVLSCTGSFKAFAYASSHEGSLSVFTLSYKSWNAFIALSKSFLYNDCSTGFKFVSYSLVVIAAASTTSFILVLPGFSGEPSLGPKYGVPSASSLRVNALSALSTKVFVTGSTNIPNILWVCGGLGFIPCFNALGDTEPDSSSSTDFSG